MTTSRSSPVDDQAIRLLREYFFSRTDKVAIVAPWGRPCPVEPRGSIEAIIEAHVKGPSGPKARYRFRRRKSYGASSGYPRVGSYVPNEDGHTPWLCIDFDGPGHADELEDPAAALLAAHDTCKKAGIRAFIEKSGSGLGWHLWIFFEQGVIATDARALGMLISPGEFYCANGRIADARASRGIEIFPKQSKLKKKRYGNLLWLPWWHDAPEGANQFYRLDDGKLELYMPEEFERIDSNTLKEVLKRLETSQPAESSQDNKPDSSTARTASNNDDVNHPAWVEWRKQALAKLDLEEIYGEWLTGGYSGDGWLQCRDPDSPTGDRDPSAGVADGTGEAERGAFHSFRTHETISVFDFLVRRGIAANFRSALDFISELTGAPLPEKELPSIPAPAVPENSKRVKRPRRPTIQVNYRPLRDVIDDAWKALLAANHPPVFYCRSGAVVRLAAADAAPRIEHVDEAAMFGRLARVADWVRSSNDAEVDVSPLKDVARDMVVYPSPKLHKLDFVVTAPVFDAEGRMVFTPGFCADARLFYYQSKHFSLPRVPEKPTDDDLLEARTFILDELLVDFPFDKASDRAHAMAALILPFVRRMIDGPTPLHLIEAPSPGTGKSLLGEAISIIAVGHSGQPMNIGRDDEENRKRITAALARAQPVVLIDNIRGGLNSATLAMALTATTYSDRVLGQTRMVDLPNQSLWIATANNPQLSLEIARRCVRIRLDPMCDRPWQGRSFKHEPLLAWVHKHRAALIHAVLVMVQAWMSMGRPVISHVLGSYESWSEVVGGILTVAGIDGFLSDLEELYELADAEGQEWREFVGAWAGQYGRQPVTAGALLNLAIEHDLLGTIIGDKSVRSQSIRLGKALLANRDRQFGRHRIACTWSTAHNQRLWQLTGQDKRSDSEDQAVLQFPRQQSQDAGCCNEKDDTSGQHPALQHVENKEVTEVPDVTDVSNPTRGKETSSRDHTRIYKKGDKHPALPAHPADIDFIEENAAGYLPEVIPTSGSELLPSESKSVDLCNLPDEEDEP